MEHFEYEAYRVNIMETEMNTNDPSKSPFQGHLRLSVVQSQRGHMADSCCADSEGTEKANRSGFETICKSLNCCSFSKKNSTYPSSSSNIKFILIPNFDDFHTCLLGSLPQTTLCPRQKKCVEVLRLPAHPSTRAVVMIGTMNQQWSQWALDNLSWQKNAC